MKLNIRIISDTTPKPPPVDRRVFKTVRKYGDPFMVKMMGLDTEFIETSNFQNVVHYLSQSIYR